jgi:hypothetical protein
MSAIHKHDRSKIIPKHKLRETVRYGNGIHLGSAIYTPRRPYYEGDGIVDGLFNFFKNNQESIKAIGNTVGSIAEATGKVSGTVMDIIKRKKELDRMGIETQALNEVVQAKKPQPITTGEGFYYLK